MLKVLLASSEAIPFAKTGGLGDVCGTLPSYFDKSECDCRVIIPKYKCIPEKYLKQMKFIKAINVQLGWRNQYCGIFELIHGNATFYFIDNEFYFGGTQLYSYIHEDVEKYSFFSKAVLSILPHIDFKPDIIHCNDWQTALVPVMLKTLFSKDIFYIGIKSILTIHNLRFQGRWGIKETQDATGLPDECFLPNTMEFYGDSNILKGGIIYSDIVTTVSKTYMEEIQTREFGEGLDKLLSAMKHKLYGIVNGISYKEFNPSTDDMVYAKYNKRDFASRKTMNKLELQKRLYLQQNKSVFMLGMVTRLTDQKGLDIFLECIEKILDLDLQIVILGTGEKRYEESLLYLSQRYASKLSSNIMFSEELARKIYAASDAFLMPSLFEPCGLSQLIAMRYGSIPIVRETGGLKDTVIPYNKFTGEGTGFSFRNYTSSDLYNSILMALETYKDSSVWNRIIRQAMSMDFSWEKSAGEYLNIYKSIASIH